MFTAEADFLRAGLMMLSSADGGDDEESDAVKITMTVLTKFDNGRIYVESKTDSDLEALFPSANTKCYFTNDGNGNIRNRSVREGNANRSRKAQIKPSDLFQIDDLSV